MVSNQTLAAFCVRIGLHQHLMLQSKDLSASIQRYIDFLEELQKKEYDFAARENRLPGQYWLDVPVEAPKVRMQCSRERSITERAIRSVSRTW